MSELNLCMAQKRLLSASIRTSIKLLNAIKKNAVLDVNKNRCAVLIDEANEFIVRINIIRIKMRRGMNTDLKIGDIPDLSLGFSEEGEKEDIINLFKTLPDIYDASNGIKKTIETYCEDANLKSSQSPGTRKARPLGSSLSTRTPESSRSNRTPKSSRSTEIPQSANEILNPRKIGCTGTGCVIAGGKKRRKTQKKRRAKK